MNQASSALWGLQNDALWRLSDVANILGVNLAENFSDISLTGISIDTRLLQEGHLFIALQGAQTNGRIFLSEAFSKGACAAVIQEDPSSLAQKAQPFSLPKHLADKPILRVRDTQEALETLGRAAHKRAKATIFIGITGSAGKTSTKNGLYHVLSYCGYNAFKSPKSYNNHIGLPLSLTNMPLNTEVGVFEMGMNHAGEISHMSTCLAPHISVITTVGLAHMEAFNAPEDIAHAKAEIFDGQKAGSKTVLNRDMPFYPLIREKAEKAGLKILTFGNHPESEVRLIHQNIGSPASSFTFELQGNTYQAKVPHQGAQWVQNSLAMIGVCSLLKDPMRKEDINHVINALASIPSNNQRGQIQTVVYNHQTLHIIDDSYNANPLSMTMSLQNLAQMRGPKIAILGDMKELGHLAQSEHAKLAKTISNAGIEKVITVGPLMEDLFHALPVYLREAHFVDVKGALTHTYRFGPDATLLIKGSRSMQLDLLVKALTESDKRNEPLAAQ